eukprot:TRINITY_DN9901_c0_g1_i1.p1 TRINITY_DN9901_c0_g1~~TRINITY_DN9901_c0_g1_i1.p1  ORF type:complete len:211 (+),score=68.80 TRINITY_DN9901_c0_g1_i1:89-634(+)
MPAPVVLNVYSLTGCNAVLSKCGMGAYHSGVEVYGIEIAFGGGEGGHTGIYHHEPRKAPGMTFQESVPLGSTRFSKEQVVTLCSKLAPVWPDVSYDLVQRNCNNFAEHLCRLLGVQAPPAWVNKLASSSPWLARRLIPDNRPEELRKQAAAAPPTDTGAPQNPWQIGPEEYSSAVLEGRMK